MLPGKHEGWLQAVVDTAVDGVILIDAHGRVLMFNPACEKLFGYTADEVIGQNVKMLMPEPYRDEHDGYLSNYHRTGERKIIGIGREVVGRRKDGSTFPMDLSVGEAKQDGQSIFVGIIHDLTERERTELALRESAARLKAVVDTAVDGVILIDAHGCVSMFNPACERLFGYRAEEVIGQERQDADAGAVSRRARRLSRATSTAPASARSSASAARWWAGARTARPSRWTCRSARPSRTARSIFVGIIHDLTERKRTEEQLVQAQKMETVGQLSGGIAHDFNNLLTVIVGNAEFLSEQLKARHGSAAPRRGYRQRRRTRGRADAAAAGLQPPPDAAARCSSTATRCSDSMHKLLRRTLREDIEIKTASNRTVAGLRRSGAARIRRCSIWRSMRRTPCRPAARLTITTANVLARRPVPRAASGGPPRRLCADRRHRQRRRHAEGGAGPGVRAVLHHQGGRQGQRPRPQHGLRLRQAVQRPRRDLQRARPRHHRADLSARGT